MVEEYLNTFVRIIAFLERTGNALGTLAFVWATVVVLGGFSDLIGHDFWVVTIIVFLEAFRAFSRQSISDDQLLFKTTGGIKLKRVELGTSSRSLYYMNAVILPLCLWAPALDIIDYHLPIPRTPAYEALAVLSLMVIVNKLGFYKFIGYMTRKECHILLQLSPAAAILLAVLATRYLERLESFPWGVYFIFAPWLIIYLLARTTEDHEEEHLLSPVLLMGTVLVLLLMLPEPLGLVILLGPLLLGNLQTPMALVRIILSWGWLFWSDIEVHDTNNINVKLAVKLLYIMVLCQGMLYMAACILESFSFLPRRSLALDSGLVDKLGMESVNLYYEQAYDTFLQESLFDTTKKICLVTFAVDSLSSDASWEKKRAAVRIIDSFLQRHKTAPNSNSELVSLITTSTKAVTTLISMLGWTVPNDADIRLFAAKVTAQLAPYLRIVGIPGTMQMVSSLLDAQDEPRTQHISAPVVDSNGGNQQISNGSFHSALDIEGGNTLGARASSSQAEQNSAKCCLVEWIGKFLRYAKELRSLPNDDSKNWDSLPALGMQILEGLAHDLHNCTEISRATEILPKIIGIISCISGTTPENREKIGTPSLRLVAKLASIKGEIGITLRQELSQNPVLISHLAEILVLEGSSICLRQSELAMCIVAKLPMDNITVHNTERIQAIIEKLVEEFLGGGESPKPLRAAAGKALAMLAIKGPNNCCAMLMDEPNYKLIGDLADKLQHGEHVSIAASLLQSLCENCRQVMRNQGPSNHLSYLDCGESSEFCTTNTLQFFYDFTKSHVMAKIMDAEGKQMDVLVGLASQLCSVLSGHIAHVLESFQDGDALAEKLVGQLNALRKPTPGEFQNIRKLLVGLTVSLVEFCPRYAAIFREHGMVEALSEVEQYILFFGSPAGALTPLVARAKLLIGDNTASV